MELLPLFQTPRDGEMPISRSTLQWGPTVLGSPAKTKLTSEVAGATCDKARCFDVLDRKGACDATTGLLSIMHGRSIEHPAVPFLGGMGAILGRAFRDDSTDSSVERFPAPTWKSSDSLFPDPYPPGCQLSCCRPSLLGRGQCLCSARRCDFIRSRR
jgi:hypothetical protein